MRVWLSGPRMLGGLVRPGVSFDAKELGLGRPLAPAAPRRSRSLATALAIVLWGGLAIYFAKDIVGAIWAVFVLARL